MGCLGGMDRKRKPKNETSVSVCMMCILSSIRRRGEIVKIGGEGDDNHIVHQSIRLKADAVIESLLKQAGLRKQKSGPQPTSYISVRF